MIFVLNSERPYTQLWANGFALRLPTSLLFNTTHHHITFWAIFLHKNYPYLVIKTHTHTTLLPAYDAPFIKSKNIVLLHKVAR